MKKIKCFVALFYEDLQLRIVLHHLFMHFDDGLRNAGNDTVSLQHRNGRTDHRIFQFLFFDGFAIAIAFASAFGNAGIIIMNVSRLARTAFPDHAVFAPSANEFAGKDIIVNLFFAPRRVFVFFIDRIHL